MSSRSVMRLVLLIALVAGSSTVCAQNKQTLEQRLLQEGIKSLAKAAEKDGDARRGAIAFHQHHSSCTKCHATGQGKIPLGPDLTAIGDRGTFAHLVESILQPSVKIRDDFKAVQITTNEGRVHVGFVATADAQQIELRDASKFGEVLTIAKDDVDASEPAKISVMPTGSANQLGNRQQFLDLVKYLFEISQRGPAMARQLHPDPSDLKALAAEKIDHAAHIAGLNAQLLKTGRELYAQFCVNCHGKDGNKTLNPLARRFAKDPLKFGTDPYAMWKTVSYGNGLMFPQLALMPPAERYAVVHYIRETFVKQNNPGQYFTVTDEYLASVGDIARADAAALSAEFVTTRIAPGMIDGKQGANMQYGPYLSHSVAYSKPANKDLPRFADTTERALVVSLPGERAVCYDVERYSVSGIWKGSIATTTNTHHTSYKGSSCLTPGGEVVYHNVDNAGWAVGDLADKAAEDRVTFKGHFLHGHQVLLRFEVGGRDVDELPGAMADDPPIYSRTLRVAAGDSRLWCLVGRVVDGQASISARDATVTGKDSNVAVAIRGQTDGVEFVADDKGGLWLAIPAASASRTFTIWYRAGKATDAIKLPVDTASPDLDALTRGGPRRWPQAVSTGGVLGKPIEGYAADEISVPYANPWGSWLRTTAIDFFADGRLAVATLSGDVWIVRWTQQDLSDVVWSRFATGLYEPLGLRIVDERIYVRGRDRITRLHDVNNDGEADYYESFYEEGGEIGPGYHAFIFDLQTDREGNFYFSKSGRKAPHKGGVVRVSPDGKTSNMICHDFRHPNGMGAGGPHDWITVSDNPSGKAIYNGVAIVREGGRYGYEGDRTVPMLSVLPARVDSSSAGQCWSDPERWGPLSGHMIHTSYSRLCLFTMITQNTAPHPNGFAVRMPFNLKSGGMRARVNPVDGQVYVVGQRGWDTQAKYDGCITRIRYVGGPSHLIKDAAATERGLVLTFSCDLDAKSIVAANFEVMREEDKGTKPVKLGGVRPVDRNRVAVDLPDIGKETVEHRSETDKKTGVTRISVLGPIRVTARIKAADGTDIQQTVFATVNSLP